MVGRVSGAVVGAGWIATAMLLRPTVPTAGSDCEVLSSGVLREPVAAVSSIAIVVAGWIVARRRAAPGMVILLAGAASIAAHASAHPGARALDGMAAAAALMTGVWSIVHRPPDPTRLVGGITVGTMAVVIWLLTRSGAPLCDIVGRWGHAAWHVLVAVAVVVALGTGPDSTTD